MLNFRSLLTTAALLAIALPAVADHHGPMAEVGSAAPDFELVDAAGKTHRLSDYEGKIVVLEWTNPDCPFVQRHYADGNKTMIDLQARLAKKDVVWLAVDSSNFVTPESAAKWDKATGKTFPTLLDPTGKVGHLYAAKTTPHMFVVGADGTLLYDGAIDDDKAGKKEAPSNYVAAAVDAVLAGHEVATNKTLPYGCSVKYQKKSDAGAR
jgi:peroxiredoxin